MLFLADLFAMREGRDPGFTKRPAFWAAPPARAERPVADHAYDVRVEIRIDAVDTNRPDYDAVPEHDPDGTWRCAP